MGRLLLGGLYSGARFDRRLGGLRLLCRDPRVLSWLRSWELGRLLLGGLYSGARFDRRLGGLRLLCRDHMSFELTAELGIGPVVAGRVVQRGEIR